MAQKQKHSLNETDQSSPGTKPPHSINSEAEATPEPIDSTPLSKRSVSPPVGLVLVATPIGNAADITLRALDILRSAHTVACEDTRVTAKLFALHGISASLTAYHEHNAAKVRPALIKRLKNGESVALVSDAGTPMVSDPGFRLVRECIIEGIPVTSAPGASSVLTALQLSGLPTDRFMFVGFLPTKSGPRKRALAEVANIPASLIFLESAKRLAKSFADMAEVLGPRDAAMARELTKMFEEVRRAPLPELARHYAESGPPKGEVTIVVAPPTAQSQKLSSDEVDEALREALKTNSLRDATTLVSLSAGWPKREVYARALALAKFD